MSYQKSVILDRNDSEITIGSWCYGPTHGGSDNGMYYHYKLMYITNIDDRYFSFLYFDENHIPSNPNYNENHFNNKLHAHLVYYNEHKEKSIVEDIIKCGQKGSIDIRHLYSHYYTVLNG